MKEHLKHVDVNALLETLGDTKDMLSELESAFKGEQWEFDGELIDWTFREVHSTFNAIGENLLWLRETFIPVYVGVIEKQLALVGSQERPKEPQDLQMVVRHIMEGTVRSVLLHADALLAEQEKAKEQ